MGPETVIFLVCKNARVMFCDSSLDRTLPSKRQQGKAAYLSAKFWFRGLALWNKQCSLQESTLHPQRPLTTEALRQSVRFLQPCPAASFMARRAS